MGSAPLSSTRAPENSQDVCRNWHAALSLVREYRFGKRCLLCCSRCQEAHVCVVAGSVGVGSEAADADNMADVPRVLLQVLHELQVSLQEGVQAAREKHIDAIKRCRP